MKKIVLILVILFTTVQPSMAYCQNRNYSRSYYGGGLINGLTNVFFGSNYYRPPIYGYRGYSGYRYNNGCRSYSRAYYPRRGFRYYSSSCRRY